MAATSTLVCSVCGTDIARAGGGRDGKRYCPAHIPSDDEPVLAAHRWPTNGHLIEDVHRLGYINDEDLVLDPTYGLGVFYSRYRPPRLIAHDLDPRKAPDGRSFDFTNLPYGPATFDVVVFDPPYKLRGSDTGTTVDTDERYGVAGKYVAWQARHDLIRRGLDHLVPMVRRGGRLLLKCQDQVCSGAIRWQTDEFTRHAEGLGLVKVDEFQFLGGRPQPAGRRQLHAHGRPSTLLVFEQTIDTTQGVLL